MKSQILNSLQSIMLFVLVTVFFACEDTTTEQITYTANVPVYMSVSKMRQSIKTSASLPMEKAGKIYMKDNYLFINEMYKGVHVFDNTNPENPQNLAFIEIPGNVDISIRGNRLYADSYMDLVVLDISEIASAHEIGRITDIFPYTIPECDNNYIISEIDQTKGVICGWKVENVTQSVESQWKYYYSGGNFIASEMVGGQVIDASSNTVGVGGSLARFTITGNTLFALNMSSLKVIDISDMATQVGNGINIGWGAETLFILGTNLFIGTQTGMHIYDVASPNNPTPISQFSHFQSCDPVVVANDYAYVTLRGGNRCGNWQNQLQVVDIKNLTAPTLVKAYNLTEPYGLGIDSTTLFVCDGSAGLKIYDATDPIRIDSHLLKTYTDIHATDVIPLNGLLIVIAAEGLYQYDYTNLQDIRQLSVISFAKK